MTLIEVLGLRIKPLRNTIEAACVCLLLITSMPFAGAAEGTDKWLYSVDQPILDQSSEKRRVAARDALLTVLSRLTGLASIPRSALINTALSSPDRYYSTFDYLRSPGRDQSGQILSIRFTFQPNTILALVRQAGLPIWWTKRPQTVAWVVVDEPTQRSILGADDSNPLIQEIMLQADLRGLPVALPLMDLDDSILVSVSDIWGKFTDALDNASSRYEAAQYLIGRFRVQEILGERLYSGEWQLMKAQTGDVVMGSLNADKFVVAGVRGVQAQKIDEVARVAVDMGATRLAEEYAIFGRTSRSHEISVSGLNSLQNYSDLVAYLRGFEFVEQVNVLALRGDVISLQVRSSAPVDRLVTLLAMEGRLTNISLIDAKPLMSWQG